MVDPETPHRGKEPPPAGAPWDVPIREAPLAFIDLEMTGLDVRRDRVVELCIERTVGDEIVDRLETVVWPFEEAHVTQSPTEELKVGNEHVHGITARELAGAPRFVDVAERVLSLVDGAIVVAHAAAWDVSFLTMEIARAGHERRIEHYLDTLVLARRAFAFHSYSLDSLCKEFAIDRSRAHRAGADVLAMRIVFERALTQLSPVSARDLWEVRVAERRARGAIVDACVAALDKGAPVEITYRPSRRKPEAMIMVLTEVRADLDPPRVIGYQLPGRGRRDLRSDRILRVEPAPHE